MAIMKKLAGSSAKLMSDSHSGGQNTLKSPGRSYFPDKKIYASKTWLGVWSNASGPK